MRKISNIAKSNCNGDINDEDQPIEDAFGWEEQIQKSREYDKNNKINVIKFANQKYPLSQLITNIKFEEKSSPSGWTHKAPCPFPDHNDSSPSFYYNPKENKFKCFGCDRYGQSVEYLSYLRKISKSVAAELLIKKYSDIDIATIENTIIDSQEDEIDTILQNFSTKIRQYLIANPNSLDFVEQLTWTLDIYLHKHVPNRSVNKDMLENRVNALLRKLKCP